MEEISTAHKTLAIFGLCSLEVLHELSLP